MNKLTASNLISLINQLDKTVTYNYINPKNRGQIQIVHIELPEGPIWIKRWHPFQGEKPENKKDESISTEMIWRVANALQPSKPINVDRILGASYNTRSVLESLLAYTPNFFFCYPGRIENIAGITKVKTGHKHIVWNPSETHLPGRLAKIETNIVVSEVPNLEAHYDNLIIPNQNQIAKIDIEIQRTHALMQVALYSIGKQLGYRTWIAQNDKGISYQNKRLEESEGIIKSLRDEKLMLAHEDAIRAALLIDCIWFKNGKLMPAVMEVEHSTGVTSGLNRMKNFKDRFPPFPTRYVIVAADEDRDRVIKEANKPQFHDLQTKFFPYSAVTELYALCQKRKLKGITEEFLDCYMEPVVA